MVNKGQCITVEPIRDTDKINEIKECLKSRSHRDYLLFVLGINSGLRISDLLKLTVADVKNGVVVIREQKTQKIRNFKLSKTCTDAIKEYLESTNIKDGCLFANQRNGNPVSKQYVWRVITQAADYVGIKDNIGTHTLRKTFAYHAIKKGVSLTALMKLLNHSSPAITMRYAGVTKDELDEICMNMNL